MRRLPVWLLMSTLLLSGCAGFMAESLTRSMTNNLSQAILNHDDPATVRDGAPAFMLMLDSFQQPEADEAPDPDMLIAGSRLYGAYAAVFVKSPRRAGRMADKARNMAARALCMRQPELCGIDAKPFSALKPLLATVERDDLPAFYAFASAWIGVLQANRENTMEVMADLPKVEAMMDRVVAIDPEFDQGRAHLFLGVLRCQRPPALGGRPEIGRHHFEESIRISKGRDLLAKVKFAKYCARLTFDRPLHQKLLHSVVNANPVEPELTLSNTLAQQEAYQLLADADEYFPEE